MTKKQKTKSSAHAKRHGTQPGREAPPPKRSAAARWLAKPSSSILIVLLISFALYANTLGHDFVWDDNVLIVENPLIRELNSSAVQDIFAEDFWEIGGSGGSYYRPLVTLSYVTDYKLSDGRPTGFHLANVVWNSLTCAMVFVFVYILFGNITVGLASALLFAAHPVHTEAVAWISGRADIFAAFWSLLALSAYVVARRRRNHLIMMGSLAAFLLAMFSKESAVCVPFLIALLEVNPLAAIVKRRSTATEPTDRHGVANPVFSIVPFFGVLAFYLFLRYQALGTMTSLHGAFAPGIVGRVTVPLSVFAGYVFKVLLPFKLSAEYDAPIPTSFADTHVLLGVISIAALAWVIWRYRRSPFFVYGIALFAIGIAPVLNIIPIGEVSAERFLYFPSLGPALVFGGILAAALMTQYPALPARRAHTAGIPQMSPPLARFLVILCVMILVLFAGTAITRNTDWKDDATLFAKTAAQEPNNPRAYALLGTATLQRGDIDGATRAYKRALALDPNNPNTLSLLAGVYVQQGKYDDALPLLRQALSTLPDDPQLNNNLGSVYLETKQYAKAKQQFMKALSLNPHQLRTHFNLGLTHMELGEADAAREYFVRALQGGPQFNMANYYLAMIEITAGDSLQAKAYAGRFLESYRQSDSYRRTAEAVLRGEAIPPQP